MQVGQEEGGEMNIIFLKTNVSIPPELIEKMLELELIKTVTPLEFDM